MSAESDRYMASAERDGFVGLSRELIDAIRAVERAAGQYDYHAAKVTTTREQRNALQAERIEARRALSHLLAP